jgi:hypothetical protein
MFEIINDATHRSWCQVFVLRAKQEQVHEQAIFPCEFGSRFSASRQFLNHLRAGAYYEADLLSLASGRHYGCIQQAYRSLLSRRMPAARQWSKHSQAAASSAPTPTI